MQITLKNDFVEFARGDRSTRARRADRWPRSRWSHRGTRISRPFRVHQLRPGPGERVRGFTHPVVDVSGGTEGPCRCNRASRRHRPTRCDGTTGTGRSCRDRGSFRHRQQFILSGFWSRGAMHNWRCAAHRVYCNRYQLVARQRPDAYGREQLGTGLVDWRQFWRERVNDLRSSQSHRGRTRRTYLRHLCGGSFSMTHLSVVG